LPAILKRHPTKIKKRKTMIYKEINPNNEIADLVKLFWQFDNSLSDKKMYTVLPDGYFDLVIIISNNKIISVTLYGIWLHQMDVTIPANSIILGITFKPLAVEYIFKNSISEIFNGLKVLNSSQHNIDTFPFNNFTDFVLQYSDQISKINKIESRKVKLFKLLFDSYGSINVEELSNKVFWQSRQINRYFNSKFGLSLKTYANILRSSIAFKDIEKGKLSPPVNFYDQSHFIKEIKKHSGTNPKELHQNKNDRFLQFSTPHKL
jgi:AraC-like DNA-binding protein